MRLFCSTRGLVLLSLLLAHCVSFPSDRLFAETKQILGPQQQCLLFLRATRRSTVDSGSHVQYLREHGVHGEEEEEGMG